MCNSSYHWLVPFALAFASMKMAWSLCAKNSAKNLFLFSIWWTNRRSSWSLIFAFSVFESKTATWNWKIWKTCFDPNAIYWYCEVAVSTTLFAFDEQLSKRTSVMLYCDVFGTEWSNEKPKQPTVGALRMNAYWTMIIIMSRLVVSLSVPTVCKRLLLRTAGHCTP